MSDKRKRIAINMTPTPAELWAQEQRTRAARSLLFQAWLSECKDG